MSCLKCQTSFTTKDQKFCHNCGEKNEKPKEFVEGFQRFQKIGTLAEFDEIVKKYPLDKYEFFGTYNYSSPSPLQFSRWNRGIRVFFRDFYPHADDAKNFHIGNAIFTRDTDDSESKSGFYHRYVDSNFKPCCCGSNEQCKLIQKN
eukprot:gene2349-2817_t